VNAGLILTAAAGSASGLVLEAFIFRFSGDHAVAISILQAGFGLSAAIALLYPGRSTSGAPGSAATDTPTTAAALWIELGDRGATGETEKGAEA
jgi:hypothetical protein